YKPEVDPNGYAAEVIEYAAAWQSRPETGLLSSIRRPDGTLLLKDTRSDAALPEVMLNGLEQATYEYCDEFRSVAGIVRHLDERFPTTKVSGEGVEGFLDSLITHRLMVTDGCYY